MMNKEVIKRWLLRHGRPLDLARYDYHFDQGNKDRVVELLSAYQNDDGGFAHGLESDCWNPISSPVQTWTATEIIHEIGGLDPSHQMVQGILRYLASGKYMVNRRWMFAVPSNNDYPRAVWWNYQSDEKSTEDYNPTASLIAFILLYSPEDSQLYRESLLMGQEAVDDLIRRGKSEMHELYNYITLYNISMQLGICWQHMDKFKELIISEMDRLIERDTKQWGKTYCCLPSHLIKDPRSIGADDYKSLIQEEASHLKESINDQGVWSITWNWQQYEQEFEVAKYWWQSELIIKNLLLIKKFS